MLAPIFDPLVNNLSFFAKTEIKSDFKCFLAVILKNCPFRFSHNFSVKS